MDLAEIDARLREIQRQYLEFLDDEEDTGKYSSLVKNMISDDRRRLIVDMNDLRKKNPERAHYLLHSSAEEQIAFSRALKDFVFSLSPDFAKKVDCFYIGFEGSFGNKHVTPRSLTNRFLGNLICVEGIVTKCSLIKPKVVKSVHFCPATGKFMERKYSDLLSLDAHPTNSVYPTKDDDGNPLETEYGLSNYIDHQSISIQEMPEKAPAGQLPRIVDIICENDLVGACKPGDRVQVVGNYRCLAGKQGGYTTGIFRCVVIANNIMQISKEGGPTISGEDVSLIKSLATSHSVEVFDLLAKSLAPSIHGHDFVKKAILCLLLGGVEKNLPNGTRLRGDINILLIGDPSVAKSQLLRYVLHSAPRAIATTGRGSTGVGLTACVSTDQESGERRLEAGAMVLADRGVVCIDEFDKMSDIDRTAIHEVMEQGRVSISKAGIHASLNARCSVLAAANPVYGRYDPYKTPMENIGLQDSLLSRFDLVFVLLDKISEDQDAMISDHVLRMNRYRAPTEQEGEILPMGSTVDTLSTFDPENEEEQKKTQMYEKYDPLLHGDLRQQTDQFLTADFIKKYINMVKIIKPVLTNESSTMISEAYVRLRSEDVLTNDVARTQPVTARSLETMIRLATAVAKARMSPTVTCEDAEVAIKLVHFANFKKVLDKGKKRNRSLLNDSVEVTEGTSKRSNRITRSTQGKNQDPATDSTMQVDSFDQSQNSIDELMLEQPVEQLTPDKYKLIKNQLSEIFRSQAEDSYDLDSLLTQVNKNQQFNDSELQQAMKKLSDENQIMISDKKVYCIG